MQMQLTVPISNTSGYKCICASFMTIWNPL